MILANRTVDDFEDWTSWLLYKGGVGVKGDNSWESWWEEEQVVLKFLYVRSMYLNVFILVLCTFHFLIFITF
jgi:hypothetical protein